MRRIKRNSSMLGLTISKIIIFCVVELWHVVINVVELYNYQILYMFLQLCEFMLKITL